MSFVLNIKDGVPDFKIKEGWMICTAVKIYGLPEKVVLGSGNYKVGDLVFFEDEFYVINVEGVRHFLVHESKILIHKPEDEKEDFKPYRLNND